MLCVHVSKISTNCVFLKDGRSFELPGLIANNCCTAPSLWFCDETCCQQWEDQFRNTNILKAASALDVNLKKGRSVYAQCPDAVNDDGMKRQRRDGQKTNFNSEKMERLIDLLQVRSWMEIVRESTHPKMSREETAQKLKAEKENFSWSMRLDTMISDGKAILGADNGVNPVMPRQGRTARCVLRVLRDCTTVEEMLDTAMSIIQFTSRRHLTLIQSWPWVNFDDASGVDKFDTVCGRKRTCVLPEAWIVRAAVTGVLKEKKGWVAGTPIVSVAKYPLDYWADMIVKRWQNHWLNFCPLDVDASKYNRMGLHDAHLFRVTVASRYICLSQSQYEGVELDEFPEGKESARGAVGAAGFVFDIWDKDDVSAETARVITRTVADRVLVFVRSHPNSPLCGLHSISDALHGLCQGRKMLQILKLIA